MKSIDSLQVNPEGSRLQRLAYWLDHRTGIETGVRTSSTKYTCVQRMAPGFGQRRRVPLHASGLHRHPVGFQLCAHAGDAYNSLRYIVTELTGGGSFAPPSLGRQHDDRVVVMHMLQSSCMAHTRSRGKLPGWRAWPAAADAGLWADRLSSALG